MKLNIIIAVKDSGERYVAENKFSFFKFVVVVKKKCTEFVCQKGNLKPECRLYASMNFCCTCSFARQITIIVVN